MLCARCLSDERYSYFTQEIVIVDSSIELPTDYIAIIKSASDYRSKHSFLV